MIQSLRNYNRYVRFVEPKTGNRISRNCNQYLTETRKESLFFFSTKTPPRRRPTPTPLRKSWFFPRETKSDDRTFRVQLGVRVQTTVLDVRVRPTDGVRRRRTQAAEMRLQVGEVKR